MDQASEYALSKFIKIGRWQLDILRPEYYGRKLGLPWFLILTKNKDGSTTVKGFNFLRQSKEKRSW